MTLIARSVDSPFGNERRGRSTAAPCRTRPRGYCGSDNAYRFVGFSDRHREAGEQYVEACDEPDQRTADHNAQECDQYFRCLGSTWVRSRGRCRGGSGSWLFDFHVKRAITASNEAHRVGKR